MLLTTAPARLVAVLVALVAALAVLGIQAPAADAAEAGTSCSAWQSAGGVSTRTCIVVQSTSTDQLHINRLQIRNNTGAARSFTAKQNLRIGTTVHTRTITVKVGAGSTGTFEYGRRAPLTGTASAKSTITYVKDGLQYTLTNSATRY